MADGSLRVLTLNLWGRNGDWPARRRAALAHLAELRPDLVGLQEVEQLTSPDGTVADQAAELAGPLGLHQVFGAAHTRTLPDGTVRRFGNALLSRHPLTASGCRPLPEGRRDEPRTVLHAIARTPYGDLPVLVTHLAWRLDASADRVRQVLELARIADRLHPPPADDDHPGWRDPPPVLLADLNAEPESDELRYLTGLTSLGTAGVRYADAWRYGGEGPGHTYSPGNPLADRGEHGRRIDYILVRGPVDGAVGRPERPRLACVEPVQGSPASDHYAVCADLRMVPVEDAG